MPNLLFPDPSVLLAFYHPAFQKDEWGIYEWQNRISRAYAKKSDRAIRISVAANNGSGKTKNLLAPCAIWTAITYSQSLTVMTTASQKQLDSQTFAATRYLAECMNAYHSVELWDIQARKLVFRPNKSKILGHVTNVDTKQEGFHPEVPGGVFAILIDEGKGIHDDIYTGIVRWTGATHIMQVSSPGGPSGIFYGNHTGGRYESFQVTAFQCPHISKEEIDNIISLFGDSDPRTRSIIYAEFSQADEDIIIPADNIMRCLRMAKDGEIKHYKEPFNRAGVDFSGGGDEMILSVWNGNKQIALDSVPYASDPARACDYLVDRFKQYALTGEYIWADAGGMGRPYIALLKDRGYVVNPVYNQKSPVGPAKLNYANRGTENWYHFRDLIAENELILLDDKKQSSQLANRHYRPHTTTGKLMAEPKRESKANGHGSPDRADAAVLALCRFNIDYDEDEPQDAAPGGNRKRFSTSELEEMDDNGTLFLPRVTRRGGTTIQDLIPHTNGFRKPA